MRKKGNWNIGISKVTLAEEMLRYQTAPVPIRTFGLTGTRQAQHDDLNVTLSPSKGLLIIKALCVLAVILLPLHWAEPARCAEIGVLATVDKTEATLEDSITLSVTINGVQSAPRLQLPPLPNFSIQSAGTSSSVRIVNGQMNASVTHTYRLTPKKAGTFIIEPIKLEMGGILYSSDPITVVVKATSSDTPDRAAWAFATMEVSNDKPYVNEQVILTLKLFRRAEVSNLKVNASYGEFRKEDLGKAREYSQVINGLQYHIHEISAALFPTRPGPVEIPAAMVELDLVFRKKRSARDPYNFFFNEPFFGSRVEKQHKILRTKSIPMEVLALPEGRPGDFSNLVGQFQISARSGKQELEVGDTTTVTLTVAGAGNIQDAQVSLPQVQDKFKIYADKPQLQKSVAGRKISGQKIFKFALIPLHEGKVVFPSISLSYFDPQAEQYVTIKTDPISLKALPSKVPEQMKFIDSEGLQRSIETGEVKLMDILPIHTVLEDFGGQSLNGGAAYWAGLIFPILLYLFSSLYIRHQRRLREDVAFSRTRRAYKVARKQLDKLSSAPRRGQKEFVAELSQILREYIGNKLNLQGTAFTATEVEDKLKAEQFQEEQVLSTCRLLEKFEACQYGQIENAQPDQLLDESINILKKLEAQP